MNTGLMEAYTNYKGKYAEFVDLLKKRIKVVSSVNEVCAALGITRSMYYQRLNYPQNIPPDEVQTLATVLEYDLLKTQVEAAQRAGHELANLIAENLKSVEVSVTFVCKKLGTDTSNFYRKQKDPRLWSQEEIQKISQVVETIKSL